MDSTYCFYICSTFSDLQEERKAVIDIISRLNQTSVAYEYFPASNEPPFEIAKSFIDICLPKYIMIARKREHFAPSLWLEASVLLYLKEQSL